MLDVIKSNLNLHKILLNLTLIYVDYGHIEIKVCNFFNLVCFA